MAWPVVDNAEQGYLVQDNTAQGWAVLDGPADAGIKTVAGTPFGLFQFGMQFGARRVYAGSDSDLTWPVIDIPPD